MDFDFKNVFFIKFFLNFSDDFKMNSSQLKIGDRTFTSRLIVGTGKYASFEETRDAIATSGAEMITLAVRRIELDKTNNTKLEKFHGRTIPNIFLRSIYLDMFFFYVSLLYKVKSSSLGVIF